MAEILFFLGAAVVAVPAVSLLALTLASLAPLRRPGHAAVAGTGPQGRPLLCPQGRPLLPPQGRPRVAVLVPAHNESANLLPTVACLKAQLHAGDRLIVIADNCSDDTADVAAAAGAHVLVRTDTTRRGKGYALAHGVDALRSHPPDVLMVVDADCGLSPNGLDVAAQACARSGRPVQLLNLMQAPAGAGVRHRLLEFAMVMKNHTRALGASRLGGACHLMGTGMALPWPLAAAAELATGHVAEDMRLGTDLAVAGHTTLFVAEARVTSRFPDRSDDAHVQKSRWEHGHLATLSQQLPRLLGAAVRHRSGGLLVLALDLCIPPLALYVLGLWALLLASTGAACLWPALWPAAGVLAVAAGCVCSAVLLCWLRFARQLLSARDLFSALTYVLWKAPIYGAYFINRRTGWIRAHRTGR